MFRAVIAVLIGFAIFAPAQAQTFPFPPPGIGCPPNSSCIPGGFPGGGNPGRCTPNPNGDPGCNGAGNPVDIITGNKYQYEIDLAPLPGELGVHFARHYNSNSTHRGLTGVGWRSTYEIVLVDLGSALQIIDADGRRLTFDRHTTQPGLCVGARLEDGRVLVDENKGAGANKAKATTYRWQRLDGSEYVFSDGSGDGHPLQSIRAASGATNTLTYLGGALDSVRDPQGRTLRFIYAKPLAAGSTRHRMLALSAIDTPVGRISYRLDDNGRLQTVTQPNGLVHRYHYESERQGTAANIWALTGISVESMQDGQTITQRLATYTYDAQGRAVRTQHVGGDDISLSYGPRAQTVISLNDGAHPGALTVYRHALVAGQWKTVEAVGPGCSTCPPSNVRYRYRIDGPLSGQLEATLRLDAQGKPLQQERVAFDGWGRPTRVELMSYASGAVLSRVQKPELLLRMQYDAAPPNLLGANLTTAQYAALWRPRLIARPSVVAGREHSIEISYNDHLQPVTTTEAGASPLDADGNFVATDLARTTKYRYTQVAGASRLVAVDGPLTDSSYSKTFHYNENGYLGAVRAPGRALAVHERDEAGRPTLIAASDGARLVNLQITRDRAGTITRVAEHAWFFDAKGGVRTETYAQRVTDAPSETPTASKPRDLGHLRHDVSSMRVAHLAPASDSERLVQDDLQRPVAWLTDTGEAILAAHWGTRGSASEHQILRFETQHARPERLFDDFGRVVAIRAPAQGWQTAAYDEADRLVRVVDPRGALQRASYDAAGRLLKLERFAPPAANSDETNEVLRFAYAGLSVAEEQVSDAMGHRSTRVERDSLGRETGVTQRISLTGAAPVTLSLAHALDTKGRRIGSTLTDATGRTSSVATVYDDHGQIASIRAPGAFADQIALRAVQWQSVQGHTVATRLNHGNGSVEEHYSQTPPLRKASAPDAAIVLASAAGPRDLLYRPRQNVFAARAHSRPGNDHDEAGLPRSIDTEHGELGLRWNAAGRLHEVTNDSGQDGLRASPSHARVRHIYDARGRRVAKRVFDEAQQQYVSTLFFYDGTQLVAEANATGAITRRYVYLGYRPLAQLELGETGLWARLKAALRGPQIEHLHTDARGAVVQVSDRAQAIRWQADVAPYGALTHVAARSASAHQPLRLIGQYADEETGLYYHGARFYDPRSGKFLSPDPSGITDALNTAPAYLLDTYAYAGGEPELYFDPDGRARLTYFAITTGANGQALGVNQGFTQARWAFTIDGIQSGGSTTTDLGRKRNDYANNGTRLLFDGGGNFIRGFGAIDAVINPDGDSIRWNASDSDDVAGAFGNFYGANRISISNFTIDDFDDDNATRLIWYLSTVLGKDRDKCKASAPGWLPPIRFAPGEADINVTRQVEPAAAGMLGNQANKQRILNCDRPSSLPVTYANDEERRRIVKYEAAAELQESPPTSAIYKDCSRNNGCRSQTDITVNGHSYYASYGRTQFVVETFLRTLINNLPNMTGAQRSQLGLDQPVRLPSGRMGTMADMVTIGKDRASAAGNAYEYYRGLFGTGLTPAEAQAHWNSLTARQRSDFQSQTGLGQTEFIDMLGYAPAGRARTEAEGQNAFASEAAMRLRNGSGQPVFRTWLMALYSSQDNYNFVSETFLKDNLFRVLNAPTLSGRFTNAEAPGTEAHRARQREIEDDLAQRVAVMHNWGNQGRATAPTLNLPRFVQDYVNEFLRTLGRGDWRSLRCSDELQDRPGLETRNLSLK